MFRTVFVTSVALAASEDMARRESVRGERVVTSFISFYWGLGLGAGTTSSGV